MHHRTLVARVPNDGDELAYAARSAWAISSVSRAPAAATGSGARGSSPRQRTSRPVAVCPPVAIGEPLYAIAVFQHQVRVALDSTSLRREAISAAVGGVVSKCRSRAGRVGVDGGNGVDVGVGTRADFDHVALQGYNGRLFRVSLAGWSVACLNLESVDKSVGHPKDKSWSSFGSPVVVLKARAFFNIVVADKRTRRDGRFIERIGFTTPSPPKAKKVAHCPGPPDLLEERRLPRRLPRLSA